MNKHKWNNPEELEFLKNNVKGTSFEELTERFNERFNLDLTVSQVRGACKKRHFNNGLSSRFLKGNASPFKGKKLTKEQYEKSAPTMFKKGNVPMNTLPIGTEKVLGDGYLWVKVDDQPKVKKSVNWKLKHRLIYEQHHGPIPPHHSVIFADGDRFNFDINNLLLVTNSEKAMLAKFRLQHKDAELTKAGVNVAKLILATSKKKRGE